MYVDKDDILAQQLLFKFLPPTYEPALNAKIPWILLQHVYVLIHTLQHYKGLLPAMIYFSGLRIILYSPSFFM